MTVPSGGSLLPIHLKLLKIVRKQGGHNVELPGHMLVDISRLQPWY